MDNRTIMQFFEWYLPPDCKLWNKAKEEAKNLKNLGITHVWFPPAYKGTGGTYDVGYGVYDLYDLGEFDQKGTVSTKYGTKEEYIEVIDEMHKNKIKVLADIVFNHKMGADEPEEVLATEKMNHDRNAEIRTNILIKAWTKFYFPGRNGKYSDFCWNWTHFHGTDWDDNEKRAGIFLFYGKHWDSEVDNENGNFDYLMGVDIDLNNVDVVKELIKWTKWYKEECNIDGFRLDALKHIRADFYKVWIKEIKNSVSPNTNIFIIGEYWKNDAFKLNEYINQLENQVSLFDIPLHYNFYNASISDENYDMRCILDNTLLKNNPQNAITFVDNHDTQPGQALESYVMEWFKPLAYALILLRNEGIPCVFYGDYYGINVEGSNPIKDKLELFLNIRKNYCYGNKKDYFDNENIIGWTQEGDEKHLKSGLAVVMSNKDSGIKNMNIGKKNAGCMMYDATGNVKEIVNVDENGNADFKCNGRSVSVWIILR